MPITEHSKKEQNWVNFYVSSLCYQDLIVIEAISIIIDSM